MGSIGGCVNNLNTVKIIYTMRLEPFRIFFSIALIYLAAGALGFFAFSSPWLAAGFFYAALAGWLWNLIPIWFQWPLPRLSELLPIVLLSTFMLVLVSAPHRSTSDALFATATGLILFRGIIYLLLRIRGHKKSIPTIATAVIFGFVIEMTFTVIRVYLTFRPVPEAVMNVVQFVSIKAMMIVIAIGWFKEPSFSKREKNMAAILLAGVFGYYAAGAALILITTLFLKERGFKYENEMD